MALAPVSRRRVLDLDEVADARALADVGAGAEAGERADARALADVRADHVAVGHDVGAVLHHHAGAEEHVGLDDHVAADDRVEAQPHRLRRHQRRPLLHGPAPGAPLEDGLGGGQLLARVDAQRLLGRAGDGPGRPVHRRRQAPPRRSDSIRSWRCGCRCARAAPQDRARGTPSPPRCIGRCGAPHRSRRGPRGSPARARRGRRSGGRSRWHPGPRSPGRRSARRHRAPRSSRRSVAGSTSGVSANSTIMSPWCRSSAGRAASTAWPVPACVACSKMSMPGATLAASARTASMPGATTRASLAAPAEWAMASTCASIDRPAMPCRTLGIAERMRTPLPAARTTIRSGCSVISGRAVLQVLVWAQITPTQLACRAVRLAQFAHTIAICVAICGPNATADGASGTCPQPRWPPRGPPR